MAITSTTITKSAGWARTDVIDQLEQAFTWLELHGTEISGLVTSIKDYNGGGTVGSASTDYHDVPIETTSGIGTGATFEVDRSSGNINVIRVNRPGYGYTDGEYVTISAENVGGSINGAVAIGLTLAVDGGATPVGYGSTNQFFDKNFSPSNDSNRPWGVLKHDFDTNKRFGVTYRGFKAYNDYLLSFSTGSSFFPFDTTNTSDKGGSYIDSFRGSQNLDIVSDPEGSGNSLDYNMDGNSQISADSDAFQYATSNSPTTHDLKLNIYRSSIDTSFAVLSFNQPSVSGGISDNTFSTFIVHNFTSDLWDLDEVFSAGITFIDVDPSLNQSGGSTALIGFKTVMTGNKFSNDRLICTRTAEAGWAQIYDRGDHDGAPIKIFSITSSQSNYTNSNNTSDNYNVISPSNATIYSRTGGFKDEGFIASNSTEYGNRYPISTYRSVIKGIPINGNLIPCPYYIPDDFVIIDLKLNVSGQDILQGDTITISGSEVYTVITGSYNKFNETAGVFFCARTV